MPEPLLLATPIGLESLGSSFDPNAPFHACRLCGACFQHPEDRECYESLRDGIVVERKLLDGSSYFVGPPELMVMIDRCTQRRYWWINDHNRKFHTEQEISSFAKHADKTGQAFTAEAAHELAPFGITPLVSGTDDAEIVDALAKAPRAPIELEEGST